MNSIIFKKEIYTYFRSMNYIFLPLIFFFLVISIFPLVIGPNKSLITKIIPGIIWITMIFTTLINSVNFFKDDYNNGVIEMYLTSEKSIEYILFLKIIICWFFTIFPIIIFIPIVSIMFNISLHILTTIFLTLLLGSPILVAIGIFGSALTMGISRNNILGPIITVPFYIPVLIFSASAIESVSNGLPNDLQIYVLLSILLLVLPTMPYLLKYTLRISINN